MTGAATQSYPKAFSLIDEATRELGFPMASEIQTGLLLRTLAASKPAGNFLELGTGTGLSTSWILDGMDKNSTLVSIDNDPKATNIARQYLAHDVRLGIVLSDGGEWLEQNSSLKFDFIFADTWHGKYLMIEKALDMLKVGGVYFIDDMLPQQNWPEGHHEKAIKLMEFLEQRSDLYTTKLDWSTGIVIAVKR